MAHIGIFGNGENIGGNMPGAASQRQAGVAA